MSNVANVPELINNFNAYSNGTQLIGVTAAVVLPNFDPITEEISGAGVMGSYETSVPGFYSSLEQEVGFRSLDTDIFSLMNPTSTVDLTFRASAQSTVKATGALTYTGMRIVERGRFKGFEPGTIEAGKQMESKLKFECLYFLYELDGKTMLEYDKLNSVFVVNGVDLLEKVRSLT